MKNYKMIVSIISAEKTINEILKVVIELADELIKIDNNSLDRAAVFSSLFNQLNDYLSELFSALDEMLVFS